MELLVWFIAEGHAACVPSAWTNTGRHRNLLQRRVVLWLLPLPSHPSAPATATVSQGVWVGMVFQCWD